MEKTLENEPVVAKPSYYEKNKMLIRQKQRIAMRKAYQERPEVFRARARQYHAKRMLDANSREKITRDNRIRARIRAQRVRDLEDEVIRLRSLFVEETAKV